MIFNQIFKFSETKVGETRWFFRSNADLIDELGDHWVTVDGTNYAGSKWESVNPDPTATGGVASNIPNAMGRYLRMHDVGSLFHSDSIGSNQTDLTASNGLSISAGSHSHTYVTSDLGGSSVNRIDTMSSGSVGNFTITASTGSSSHSHTVTGDAETRPHSTVGNLFMKIDEELFENRLLWRAPVNLSITTAIITLLKEGSGGVLEIDIKIGSNLASLTSIFSTRPSVGFGQGDYASSSNAVISNGLIAVNDWIELSVVSRMTGQSNFHVQVSANPL